MSGGPRAKTSCAKSTLPDAPSAWQKETLFQIQHTRVAPCVAAFASLRMSARSSWCSRSRRAGQGSVAAAGLQQLSLRATGHGSVSVHDGRGVRHALVSGRNFAAGALLLQPRPERCVRRERRLRERRARLRPAGRSLARAARCLGRWVATGGRSPSASNNRMARPSSAQACRYTGAWT